MLVVSKSVADARNDRAFINGNPLVVSGGFKMMVFDVWADRELIMSPMQKITMIFFIVLKFTR
jgi:hypothetical protein